MKAMAEALFFSVLVLTVAFFWGDHSLADAVIKYIDSRAGCQP